MRQKKKKQKAKTQKNPFQKLFRNQKLLASALAHPSHAKGSERGGKYHFERLEYLGDSVLGLVISEKLFLERPKAQEGELSHAKSILVSRKELAKRAEKLRLGRWLEISNHRENEPLSPKILADGLEAVIGALFLDCGLKKAAEFIHKIFPKTKASSQNAIIENPKGKLQEVVQKIWKLLPAYTTLPHKKGFKAVIETPGGKSFGIAKSKKEAEEAAATKLVPRLTKKFSR